MKKLTCVAILLAIILGACTSTQESIPTPEPPAIEVTSEPEPTAAPEQEVVPGERESSEHLSQFTFHIEELTYTLPFPLTELEADGWGVDGDWPANILWGWESGDVADLMLYPDVLALPSLVREGQRMTVTVLNPTEHPISFREGRVVGIFITEDWGNFDIVLPGNIRLGSTYDEVLTAYGVPTEREESEHHKRLDYRKDSVSIMVGLDAEGIVHSVMFVLHAEYSLAER